MKKRNLIFKIAFPVIILLTGFTLVYAQNGEPTYRSVNSQDQNETSKERSVVSKDFKKKKAGNSASSNTKKFRPSISRRRPARSRNKTPRKTVVKKTAPTKSNNKKEEKLVSEELGFTLWKLRKKNSGETNPSLQVWEDGVKVEYVPERIESDTKLAKGDKIRITIESPREGYLYIFNREKLTDGTYGEPYLIFPTKRTRDGNNKVKAGKLIDIPAQEDDPPLFEINSDNPYYAGEILSVIVSEKPLNEIPTPADTIRFSDSKLNDWLEKWEVDSKIYEMEGGKGLAWTNAEKDASDAKLERSLTQSEPSPQTVYSFQAKPNIPILVNFALSVKTDL